jgi:N-methylhydantoinase B
VIPAFDEFKSKALCDVRAGDLLRHATPGGGGWGDALERVPEKVVDDVLDRRITREEAEAIYGVVMRGGDTLVLDERATRKLRKEIESRRVRLRVKIDGFPYFEGGLRVAGVAAAPEGPAEIDGWLADVYSTQSPTPLTVLLRIDGAGPRDVLVLDEEASMQLKVEGGEEVLLMPVADFSEERGRSRSHGRVRPRSVLERAVR